jgi:hypothetical protein
MNSVYAHSHPSKKTNTDVCFSSHVMDMPLVQTHRILNLSRSKQILQNLLGAEFYNRLAAEKPLGVEKMVKKVAGNDYQFNVMLLATDSEKNTLMFYNDDNYGYGPSGECLWIDVNRKSLYPTQITALNGPQCQHLILKMLYKSGLDFDNFRLSK